MIHLHIGEFFALGTAVIWGASVILFKKSGESVHPFALNLFKNLLATLLFLPTLWVLGKTLTPAVPYGDYLLLLVSGAIGIGIADTLFFKSLNLLGAGLSAIVDCLYSPFVIGLSMMWLGERLNGWQSVGVVLIVGAVLIISVTRSDRMVSRRNIIYGVVLGAVSMALMALGIVMIKRLLERSPLLWVTEVRLMGGSLILLATLPLFKRRRMIVGSLLRSTRRQWLYILTGSFLGAYIAMVVWLTGFKYAAASIASALNQTSNIFIFLFAVIFLKEPITSRRVTGLAMAIGGVLMVTLL